MVRDQLSGLGVALWNVYRVRSRRRRIFTAAVSLLMCLSVTLQQTQAIPIMILTPNFFASCSSETIPSAAVKGGMPMPWQGADPAGPFSVVNVSDGELFTTIPIVSWGGDQGITFALYHSPHSGTTTTIGNGWSHSYSDKILVVGSNATYYTSDGRSIRFTLSGSPQSGTNAIYRMTLAYNSSTSEWTLTEASQRKRVFDSNGRLLSVKNPNGDTTVLTYQTGALRTITDPVGRELNLGYDSTPKLATIVPPDLATYVGNGNFDPVEREWTLEYNSSSGKLEHVVSPRQDPDLNDYRTTFSYTSGSFLYEVRDFRAGSSEDTSDYDTIYSYDSSERVTLASLAKVIDYDISSTVKQRHNRSYAYVPPSGGISKTNVTDPRGEVWEYSFDSGKRLLTVKDPLSQTLVTTVWNSQNRPKCMTNVLGGTNEFTYDSAGNPATITTPRGTWTLDWNGNNYLESIEDAMSTPSTVGYTYGNSSFPNVVTAINGEGASDTTLGYTSTGLLNDIDGPTAVQTAMTYDSNRNVQTLTFGSEGDHEFNYGTTGEQLKSHKQTVDEDAPDNTTPDPDVYQHFPIIEVPDEEESGSGPINCACPSDSDASGNVAGFPGGGCASCPPEGCPGGGFGPGDAVFSYDGNNHILTAGYLTYAYDARQRLLTQMQIDVCDIPGCAAFDVVREYSDSTGRLRVVAKHIELGSVCEVTEYFRDDAGRLSEIRYDTWSDSDGDICDQVPTLDSGDTLVTYTYSISSTPHITETRPQSVTQITLADDGLIATISHSTDGGDAVSHDYTRDANGRIIEDQESRTVDSVEMTATTTYTYGAGNLSSGDLASNGPETFGELHYDWLSTPQTSAGDPNRLVKERRYGTNSNMGPFHKREYWYDPAGNRLAMRESTPAASESNDTVTAVTCYNYWRMSEAIDDSDWLPLPGKPSSTAAYPSGAAKDQLLSEQRVEYSGSSVAYVTGTIYEYGTRSGAYNQNALTGKHRWHLKNVGSNSWRRLQQRDEEYKFQQFMFQSDVTATWENYADNSGNALTDQGRLDEHYYYDWFGRLAQRVDKDCTRTCGSCPEEHMNVCNSTCPADDHMTIFYGYDGLSNRVLSERGIVYKSVDCTPDINYYIHATYTPGALGNAFRVDRAGTIGTTDDVPIEPLFDGMMNNVGAVWGSGANIDFEQTTAFGQALTETGTGAPVSQLGSFAWRGREGTISYRYNTDAGHANLFRMGDRPYDPSTGRFTQSDRLILDALGPLAANRYIYAAADPENYSDPSGFSPLLFTMSAHAVLQAIHRGISPAMILAGMRAVTVVTYAAARYGYQLKIWTDNGLFMAVSMTGSNAGQMNTIAIASRCMLPP